VRSHPNSVLAEVDIEVKYTDRQIYEAVGEIQKLMDDDIEYEDSPPVGIDISGVLSSTAHHHCQLVAIEVQSLHPRQQARMRVFNGTMIFHYTLATKYISAFDNVSDLSWEEDKGLG
jgi:hypothetical protein